MRDGERPVNNYRQKPRKLAVFICWQLLARLDVVLRPDVLHRFRSGDVILGNSYGRRVAPNCLTARRRGPTEGVKTVLHFWHSFFLTLHLSSLYIGPPSRA
jgi:hypothetical protein